jgi:hypothetical protein
LQFKALAHICTVALPVQLTVRKANVTDTVGNEIDAFTIQHVVIAIISPNTVLVVGPVCFVSSGSVVIVATLFSVVAGSSDQRRDEGSKEEEKEKVNDNSSSINDDDKRRYQQHIENFSRYWCCNSQH